MATLSRRTVLRRGLLLGAVTVGGVAGFSRGVHHRVAVPPPPPPAALTDQLDAARSLSAGYERTLEADAALRDRLSPLQADVTAHADALAAVLELYPGWRLASASPSTSGSPAPSPSATPAPAGLEALLAATRRTAALAGAGCARWPIGEVQAARAVPLLGSIAACLATHATVLG
jgi:hypothetical protein